MLGGAENKMVDTRLVAALVGLAVLGLVFTGMDLSIPGFGDTDCEWVVAETPDGQTFESLQELEDFLGTEKYEETLQTFDENPNLNIRDPADGPVEYQGCSYQP